MKHFVVPAWVCGFVLLTLQAWPVGAGILDPVHVYAKDDAPLEADHPGYEVILFDSHSDLLVAGYVVVPEGFGKETGGLTVVDPSGQQICLAELAPNPRGVRKAPYYEFNLRRDYLKNSTMTLSHSTPDNIDFVVVHLGAFSVKELRPKDEAGGKPAACLALAEQGLFGEQYDDFTQTDKVPLEEGQSYGFRLYFRGDGRSLPLRIEQTLPQAPKTWGSEEAVKQLKISEDGRTASATITVPTAKLLDEMRWTVAEGDPEGDYTIKVFVRNELVKTFVYHVQKPPAKPEDARNKPEA